MKAVYDEFTRTPELVGLAIEVERQGDRLHARFVGPWGPWQLRLRARRGRSRSRPTWGATESSRTSLRAARRPINPSP